MSGGEFLLVKNFAASGELAVKSRSVPRGYTGFQPLWLRRFGDVLNGRSRFGFR